jgi:DNA replication protein DnaC
MKHTVPTERLLSDLKLSGILSQLPARLKQAQEETLSPEDCLNLLLHDELEHRKNTRIHRLLKTATLKPQSCLEGIDYSIARGIEKSQISDLSRCGFIKKGINILVLGPTGVGKSFLASALGNCACRSGHTTIFSRMNTLLEQSAFARLKGTYLSFVKKYSSCDLLILDDFGIKPLTAQQFQDLYDILDERSEEKSTIVTSQVPPQNWNEVISDPITCEAITDRLISKGITIQMKGQSYRKKKKEDLDQDCPL